MRLVHHFDCHFDRREKSWARRLFPVRGIYHRNMRRNALRLLLPTVCGLWLTALEVRDLWLPIIFLYI